MSARAAIADPFGSDDVEELLLARPPLVRVLAQVRFPTVASVGRLDFIGPFQEAMRRTYPILRGEQEVGIVIGPAGISQTGQQGSVWRFTDAEGAWRLSLAPGFLALETSTYKNRDDFLARLRVAVQALSEHIQPLVVDRIGVRYINRLTDPDLSELPHLIRPEALGLSSLAFGVDAPTLVQSLTVAQFALADGQLQVRMGLLPPNVTADPGIEPADQASWLLDMDMFRAQAEPFDVERTVRHAEVFAKQAYRFFRWVVTDELLTKSGGHP